MCTGNHGRAGSLEVGGAGAYDGSSGGGVCRRFMLAHVLTEILYSHMGQTVRRILQNECSFPTEMWHECKR